MDHAEIDQLLAMPKIPERFLNMERYRTPPEMVPEGERVCPRCQTELSVITVDGIALDACVSCSGFFCDIGEVGSLVRASEIRYAQKQRAGEQA